MMVIVSGADCQRPVAIDSFVPRAHDVGRMGRT